MTHKAAEICVDTGREVGYGTVPIEKSPITGGAVRPYQIRFRDTNYSPRQIHEMFYGRAHLVFGWTRAEQHHAVPWDHLADYCAAVVEDTLDFVGPGERPLAYVFGWMAHIVGDCLIKSIRPGLTLNLLDGKYTPKNRPIQDLVTFHEIGRRVLHLNWPALLTVITFFISSPSSWLSVESEADCIRAWSDRTQNSASPDGATSRRKFSHRTRSGHS